MVAFARARARARALRCVALAVAYLRNLFPGEAFRDCTFGSTTVKALAPRDPASGAVVHEDANRLAQWMEAALEAVELRYLRSIVFGIYSGEEDPSARHLLESYVCTCPFHPVPLPAHHHAMQPARAHALLTAAHSRARGASVQIIFRTRRGAMVRPHARAHRHMTAIPMFYCERDHMHGCAVEVVVAKDKEAFTMPRVRDEAVILIRTLIRLTETMKCVPQVGATRHRVRHVASHAVIARWRLARAHACMHACMRAWYALAATHRVV
ncbi:hypothetical protein EON67_04040 [archaeon]|nr:MAG: hypothetical protein EON67_04040 [archaeon]